MNPFNFKWLFPKKPKNNLEEWLLRRIAVTEIQKATATDLNLKIGKGGKLCAYKEILNYIRTR